MPTSERATPPTLADLKAALANAKCGGYRYVSIEQYQRHLGAAVEKIERLLDEVAALPHCPPVVCEDQGCRECWTAYLAQPGPARDAGRRVIMALGCFGTWWNSWWDHDNEDVVRGTVVDRPVRFTWTYRMTPRRRRIHDPWKHRHNRRQKRGL